MKARRSCRKFLPQPSTNSCRLSASRTSRRQSRRSAPGANPPDSAHRVPPAPVAIVGRSAGSYETRIEVCIASPLLRPYKTGFTDRPARMAGHMQTSKLIPLWSHGKDSFLKDNPNATLSVFRGDNVSDLVVELSNPQLSGNDLTYDARILEGTPPVNGGACALFIDIIGMPATPMSYAGVAR